jgi:hypothetical protein
VTRFSAGCRAGVENTHTGTGVEQRRRKLGAGILDGYHTFLKSWQFQEGDWLLEANGRGHPGDGLRGNPCSPQLGQIILAFSA